VALMTGLSLHIRSKTYPGHDGEGPQNILSDLRFSVGDAEIVCLVGPSGCGKTTLLNIIAGVDEDYDGTVNRSDTRLGFVFQEPRLLPWLTVRENIELVMEQVPESGDVAGELLDAMNMRSVEQAYPRRLSLGMGRRVSLARALAVAPDLLLLDEPFVSLDKPTAERLRGILLDSWRARRISALMVTHDLDEALQFADRIVFLSRSPTHALLDWAVPSPRADGATVEQMKRNLLDQHPEVLTGAGSESTDQA
jgi:ABC-type nitrate/sulfonate/bicarbonate transport system ATPase subunit